MTKFTGESARLTRRDFLKLLRLAAINAGLFTAGAALWSYFVEPAFPRVETVRLKLPRLPSAFYGLRIAQLSDIHMGGWMNSERLQHVVDLVVQQEPDIVLWTGDFLIGHEFNADSEVNLHEIVAIVSPLANRIPSFGILGNHDYWTNANAIREMLKFSAIVDLTNSVFTISQDAQTLHLCGVDDIWEGDVRLAEVVEKLPDDSAAILLAHEPDFADVSAATGRFDVQISGHSHGGQVDIPFYGPPILPHLGKKYPRGLYQVGNMLQYTNRGVGMIDPAVRLNCPPEITIFQLEDSGP